MNLLIYQIYFDENSHRILDSGFIPIDNRSPIDPELYEFSVIYRYFKEHGFEDETFYGFLSPSFYNKTVVTSSQLFEFVNVNYNKADAFYISSGWDQIAYHQNVFYQGEFFHPGFMNVASEFFQAIGGDPAKVFDSYSVFNNTVYSNYVVANGRYWKAWFELAEKFYGLFKSGIVSSLHLPATYAKTDTTQAVFLQERLHTYLLMQRPDLRVVPYDTTLIGPMLLTMFIDTPLNRKLIRSCEALKCQFLAEGDLDALNLYHQIQKKVKFS